MVRQRIQNFWTKCYCAFLPIKVELMDESIPPQKCLSVILGLNRSVMKVGMRLNKVLNISVQGVLYLLTL